MLGYTGSVAVHPYTEENRAAHGGVTYHEVCRCGAERAVNAGQGARLRERIEAGEQGEKSNPTSSPGRASLT